MGGPLDGVKVLDLTRVLAGPYATMLLSDFGADVIKVEPPNGDDTRHWGPPWQGDQSAYFVSVNRNKRSIVLNLKDPEGRRVLEDLVVESDLLIENFKPGTLERLGLGYEKVLRPLNRRLVFCSITGYGRDGPQSHLPGYDTVIEAMGGFMSITGETHGAPMKAGVAIIDIITGCHAALASTAALMHARFTGEGQRVDLSLLASNLSALVNQASHFLVSNEIPPRHGNAHPNIVPYQVFESADGPVMVAVGNDSQFVRFCKLLGLEGIASDPRFVTNPVRVANRALLVPILAQAIVGMTRGVLVEAAEAHGVPVVVLNSLDKVFEHPQVVALDMVKDIEHAKYGTVKVVGSPISMSRTPTSIYLPPPMLGEHTEEILAELVRKGECATKSKL